MRCRRPPIAPRNAIASNGARRRPTIARPICRRSRPVTHRRMPFTSNPTPTFCARSSLTRVCGGSWAFSHACSMAAVWRCASWRPNSTWCWSLRHSRRRPTIRASMTRPSMTPIMGGRTVHGSTYCTTACSRKRHLSRGPGRRPSSFAIVSPARRQPVRATTSRHCRPAGWRWPSASWRRGSCCASGRVLR